MSIFNDFYKKEKPFFTGIARGFGFGGGAAGGGGFSASGGTKTSYSTYKVHTFLSSGSFVVENAPDSFACDILVVGGGGAGGGGEAGAYEAGGGGAGGFREFPNQPVGSGTFTVTVGDGGANDGGSDYAPGFGGYSELALPSPLRSEGGGVGGGVCTSLICEGEGGVGGGVCICFLLFKERIFFDMGV